MPPPALTSIYEYPCIMDIHIELGDLYGNPWTLYGYPRGFSTRDASYFSAAAS